MTDAAGQWKVLDHGSIRELAGNLWWVDGALPRMSLRRTMTVARMSDGGLVIHNGIALNDQELARLLALGTPSYLLVPNAIHRTDAPAYKKRFPALRVLAPRGACAKVAQVVAVDGSYDDFPVDSSVSLEGLPGMNDAEGAMRVQSPDGVTIVLNDIVFNMDRKRDLLGFLITTALGSAPGPRVSRLAKLVLVKDKAALRTRLEQLAATPRLVRLIVAHEKVASGADAAAALRQAATYL